MWTGWHRRWRATLFTALAAVGLVLAASVIILRVWGPAFTREHVETLLSEALGQPVHLGAVHLQLWRLRVSLIDVDVAANPTSPGGMRLRAAAIDVGLDIASLWRRRITLSAIATDLDLEMTVGGKETSSPTIFPLPEFFEVGPLRVGIGSVRVKNGRGVIRQAEPALTTEIVSADVTARQTAGDLEISGRIDSVIVDTGHREQIDRVALDGRLSAHVIRIRRIGWRWQGESMEIEGEVRNPWVETRELSVRAKGDVSLAAVASATGLGRRVDGKARVTAEITGPVAAVRIGGRVRIPELGLAEVTIREVIVDGRWADQRLRLDDIRAHLGTGRIKGRLETGSIVGGSASFTLDLREVVLPGDLAKLGPGTAVAEGSVHDGGVDLRRGQATWRSLAASLDGRIAGGAALAVHARLSADLREIGRAMSWDPMSGRASVSAELSGRDNRARALEGKTEIVDLIAAGHAVEPIQASFRMTSSSGSDTRWEGTVQTPRVAWKQVTVENIAALLTVDGKRIEATSVRARAAAIPIEATALWEWTGAGRGRASLGPASLGGIQGVPSSLRIGGTGRATVDATVERGLAVAKALVELDQVTAAGVPLGAGRSEVRVRGRALEGELSFASRRLRAVAAGRLGAGETLTGRVDIDDLILQPLLRELGSAAADHVEGRVSGRGEVSVPLDQPSNARAIVRLMPDGLRLLGQPWTSQGPLVLRWEAPRLLVERFRLDGPSGSLSAAGALVGPDDRGLSVALDNAALPGALAELGRGTARAAMRLDRGNFELTRLDAKWPRLTATASGQARADGSIEFSGRVDAEIGALGPALGMSGASGRVVLSADARGRRDAIEATGSVRAPRIGIRGATVSDVEVPFRFSQSTLRVERAHAMLGTSRVSADASATWPGAGRMTADSLTHDVLLKADIRAPAAHLEDLGPLLPPALNGRGEFAITAHAEGTTRAWRGSGTLTAPLVELAAGPLRQLRAQFALDQARLEATDVGVDALGVPTRATASWAWAGGGSAKATLGPASLAGLTMVPASTGVEGTGRATIEAVVRSPADVTGAAHVAFDDVAVGGVRLGRGQLDASAKDGAFRAELAFPQQRLQASGRARVEAGNVLSAELTLPGIDLGLLAKALGPPPVEVGGTLSARATGRVPLAEPRRGEGLLTIESVRLVVGGETWETRGPIAVRWAQGAASLAAFRLASKEGWVSGDGALSADGKLDARATAQLPLAMLTESRPEIREIGGTLEVALRASGSLGAPVFAGDGAIHRGNLLLRDRPETLRDLEARFSLSSQGIQLREATGALSGGRVQARGDLALRDWRPGAYRVRVQAQNVAVGQIGGFSSAWDADLELAGLTREAQLAGRARLVRGLYNRDLSIVSLVMSPARAAAADTATPLRLLVRVDLDDNLVVRTRPVNLRSGGVLNVEGTTARPVVFGSIESRDGRIVFRGRDWSVTSATVRFADPRRLDPYLDVLATSHIAEYDVTMQISGPVSNVNVRFSSTPRLPQNDLLSLVAFGVTGSDLKESPGAVLLGEAGKLLAQNVLGVDPAARGLRVSTGSASGASEIHGFPGEERSTAASRTAPGTRKDTVRVEYQLWAPLFLSGEYDREGGYGTDVILRFRFR